MAISQEYIAELSRRIDIAELIGSYVELKRAGRMERGLCPFHNEKTPSFYVYPETNSFYCFGCGAGGDGITFVKNIQNLDYVEAVKFLASRVGMPLPDEDDKVSRTRGKILAINRESARYFVEQLNAEQGKEARKYLRARGLSDGIIRRFGIGFAPEGFNNLRNHLKDQGYHEQDLILAGLCKQGQKGNVYDSFRNRVMFPIIDLRGNVIAFGGRRMGEEGPKYINSPDTPVFKKSRGLFALNIAKKSADRKFILAEGYMDVISLHQAGFSTAVATLGTALTDEQARLISDYADEAVICYDSDEAGQKATNRAIRVFRPLSVKVTVLHMDQAKDPDEFIKKYGAEKFEQLLNGSRNIIEYNLNKAKQKVDLTTHDGKAGYIQAALEILAAEAKPAEQDIYAGRLADETDVSKAAILNQLEGVIVRRNRRQVREREKRILSEGVASSISVPYTTTGNELALGVVFAEQQLVAALIKEPGDFLPLVSSRLSAGQFISPEMQQAYTAILNMANDKQQIDITTLSAQLPEQIMALLGKIIGQNYGIGFTRQDVEMFLQRIEENTTRPSNAGAMTVQELEDYFNQLKERKQ